MWVPFLALVIITALLTFPGCSRRSGSSAQIAEGVLLSVAYQYADGTVHGYTRLNDAKAVPGGNGAWNIDMHGKLTHDFLIITRPQHLDLGPDFIPVARLVEVQFGDGGIKAVDEAHPR